MTVPANVVKLSNSPRAEVFQFIFMALVKLWLSLKVWNGPLTKVLLLQSESNLLVETPGLCSLTVSSESYFYSSCCSPHPDDWTWIPFALSLASPSWTLHPALGASRGWIVQSNPRWSSQGRNEDLFWQAQGASQPVTSLCPPQALRGTWRKGKEEGTGQAGSDTTLRMVFLPSNSLESKFT